MWYSINFDQRIMDILPTFLRKNVLFGVVKALVSPIADLHFKWLQYRLENIKILSYNGQKCYLRKVLNDRWDVGLRRITIGDTLNVDQDYIYTPAENLNVFLGTMFLETEFNYAGTTVDFLVNVPQSVLAEKENEIIATLEFYKLAGKKYQIIPTPTLP